MAVLGTYRIMQTDILPSQSGNGIIALYNKSGSGKKVYIKNAEIQNFRRDAIGTNSRVTDFEFLRITAQDTGKELTPVRMDSGASSVPSQIKVYKGGNPTFATQSVTISATTSLTFTVGPPGTITRGGGSWITDGIIQRASVTISGSASNNNTFLVRSCTASAITVETQHPVVNEGPNASATATATIPVSLGRFSVRHSFFAATTNAYFNNFNTGCKGINWGSVYNAHLNGGGTIEPIWLAEGEGLAITMPQTFDLGAATDVKEFHTYIIEVMFTLDSSPARTYMVTDYVTPNGESQSLLSIMNNSGSGRNVRIVDISIGEAGDTSTPYFMLVPFDSIETLALSDPVRDLPYMKMDSSNSNIDSYVEIKKDVPLFPKGFSTGNPLFPMSFGSSVPATGLNYLVTKDFLGPVYSSFFPEKSAVAGNPTNTLTNNFLSISQRDSTFFVGDDLYLSEGEGIAIVAAAEPLTLQTGVAQQVNKFSTGKYAYSLTFTVEDVSVTLTLTGLVSNSEVRIYTHGTTTELSGIENCSSTFSYEYVYESNTYVDIVILHPNYQYYKIDNLLLANSTSSIPVQQILDRVYENS